MRNLRTYLTIVFFLALVFGLFFNVGVGYAQTGNTFFGTGAGVSNTIGDNNVFNGYLAGTNNTTGSYNLFIGFRAGGENTTGNYNVFSGYLAGFANTTGHNNIFSGAKAGRYNTTGSDNIFSGYRAGYLNTTGSDNVFIGNRVGYFNTIGINNVFSGSRAGIYNTTGSYNIFTGYRAGYNNTTGSDNIFIGRYAGRNANVNNSLFLGREAGLNETNDARLHIANNNVNPTSLIYGEFDDAQVGINTTYIPADYTLAVNGKMITEEVKIRLRANWPDYVFAEDYDLLPITSVKNYIEIEGHLPNMPSAEEVAKDGFELGEMDAKLLEKIEELTLYMIDQNQQIEALKAEIEELKE